MAKPNILDVVGQYVQLRKMGREYVGLCPFHVEKTPSFAVSPDKQLFHCFGCGAGGNIFDFVMRMEDCDFRTAVQRLGLETHRPSPERVKRRNEVKKIVWWAHNTSNRLRDHLREIGDKIWIWSIARKEPGVDRQLMALEESSLIRQWAILCDLDDDLNDPTTILEIWEQREDIDWLLESIT
jgi:hypothetical protein